MRYAASASSAMLTAVLCGCSMRKAAKTNMCTPLHKVQFVHVHTRSCMCMCLAAVLDATTCCVLILRCSRTQLQARLPEM